MHAGRRAIRVRRSPTDNQPNSFEEGFYASGKVAAAICRSQDRRGGRHRNAFEKPPFLAPLLFAVVSSLRAHISHFPSGVISMSPCRGLDLTYPPLKQDDRAATRAAARKHY